MQIVTLTLSIIGACLGIASFYLTQLRPPRIQVIAERRIRVGYALQGPAFGVHVPLAFVNRSQRTGVVHKITLILRAEDADAPAFCIDLSRFVELDPEKTGYRDVALPHSFAVPGNSSVSHLVKFMWWNDSHPKFILGTQAYTFSILIWTKPGGPPDAATHHILHPTESQASVLEKSRQAGDGVSIEVVLDRGTPGNRLLKQNELQREFGLANFSGPMSKETAPGAAGKIGTAS